MVVVFHQEVTEMVIAGFVELLPHLVNIDLLFGFHRTSSMKFYEPNKYCRAVFQVI